NATPPSFACTGFCHTKPTPFTSYGQCPFITGAFTPGSTHFCGERSPSHLIRALTVLSPNNSASVGNPVTFPPPLKVLSVSLIAFSRSSSSSSLATVASDLMKWQTLSRLQPLRSNQPASASVA